MARLGRTAADQPYKHFKPGNPAVQPRFPHVSTEPDPGLRWDIGLDEFLKTTYPLHKAA